jgi:hypothetical protein
MYFYLIEYELLTFFNFDLEVLTLLSVIFVFSS